MQRPRWAALGIVLLLAVSALPAPASAQREVRDALQISGNDDIDSLAIVSGRGSESSPWTIEHETFAERNGTALAINDVEGHVRLSDLNLSGRVGLTIQDVEHVIVEDITVNATAEAMVFSRVGNLTIRRVNLTAPQTALVIAEVNETDVRDVKVFDATDGIVLSHAKGTVVLGTLRVRNTGVIAHEFGGWIQNLNVVGACAGVGFEIAGGDVAMIGNSATCREAGARISKARSASLEGDAFGPSFVGVESDESALVAKGVHVRGASEAGIRVRGGSAQIVGPIVEGGARGIELVGADASVVGARVSKTRSEGLLVQGGKVCEDDGLYEDAPVGIHVVGAQGDVAGSCGTGFVIGGAGAALVPGGRSEVERATIGMLLEGARVDVGKLVVHGVEKQGIGVLADGSRSDKHPWQEIRVEDARLGLHVKGGSDVRASLVTQRVLAAALVEEASRLGLDHGEIEKGGEIETGIVVREGSALALDHVLALGKLTGVFVDAIDSYVSDNRSMLTGDLEYPESVGFLAFESELHLDGTSIKTAGTAVRIDEIPAALEGTLPNASRIKDVAIAGSQTYGIHLVHAVAEISGGTIEDTGQYGARGFTEAGARQEAHAIFAERESAFIVRNGTLLQHNAGDGIHWTGAKKVQASDLFPPRAGAPSRSNEAPRIDGVVIRNSGNVSEPHEKRVDGIDVRDVPATLGFYIRNATVRGISGTGMRFQDVDVVISESTLTAAWLDGIRSRRTTDTSGHERFELRTSTLVDHKLNGVVLEGHGEGTLLANNSLHDIGIDARHLRDQPDGHALVVRNSTSQRGPLILGNELGPTDACAIRVNSSAIRIEDNRMRNPTNSLNLSGNECALHANRSTYTFVRNDIDLYSVAVLSDDGGGLLAANKVRAKTGFIVRGDGTRTVDVKDNVFSRRGEGTAAGDVDGMSPSDCYVVLVCWSGSQGTIRANTLSTNATAIELQRGPGLPDIESNNITFGFAALEFPRSDPFRADVEPVAAAYMGAKIRNNVFRSTYEGNERPQISNADHGAYTSSGPDRRTHLPPLGIDLRGNTFVGGGYVECHRYTIETSPPQTFVDPDHACQETGRIDLRTHLFGGDAAGTPGHGDDASYHTDLPTTERASPELHTIWVERPIPCKGYVLGATISVKRVVQNEFLLTGSPTWQEAGPWNGKLCDDVSDIKLTMMRGDIVLGTFRGDDVVNGNVTVRHTFPTGGPFKVTFRATLDSKAPTVGRQIATDTEEVYTGEKPVIREITTDVGTMFLERVPVPGGVRFYADVFFSPDSKVHYVDFYVHGRATRAWGERPSVIVQPGDLRKEWSVEDAITAQAFDVTNERSSEVVAARLKIVPFPVAILYFAAPGEVETQIVRDASGKGEIQYKIEIPIVKGEWEYESNMPVFGGKWSEENLILVKLTLQNDGSGSVSGVAMAEMEGDSKGQGGTKTGRFTFGFAGRGEVGGIGAIDDVRLTGVRAGFKLEGTFGVNLYPSDVIPQLKAAQQVPIFGRIAAKVDEFAKIYVAITPEIEGDLSAQLAEDSVCARTFQAWRCSVELTVKPAITIGAEAGWSEDLKAHAYGKGAIYWVFTTDTATKDSFVGVKEWGLEYEVGLEVKVYDWEKTWKRIGTTKYQSPGKGAVLDEETEWAIPPRTWTDGGSLVAADARVLRDLTESADPAVASDGSTMLVAWVRDDLARPWPRSGEIALALRDASGTWRELPPLTRDDLADRAPSVAAIADGSYLVAWQRDTDTTLSTSTPLTEAAGRGTEVVAAIVRADGTASAPTQLTRDGTIDLAPQATPRGVVWAKRVANVIVPEPGAAPDEVWAASARADGTLGAPSRVLAAAAEARAYAWSARGVHVALATAAGEIVLATASPDGTGRVDLPLGQAGDATPTLALRADANGTRVAWSKANASSQDLMESIVDASGTRTRLVAPSTLAVAPTYADGATPTLVWSELRNGSAIFRSADGAAPQEIANASGLVRVEWARVGASTELALFEEALVLTRREVSYQGPNVEAGSAPDNPATVNFTRVVSGVERGERTLRLAAGEPRRAAPALEQLVVEDLDVEAVDGVLHVRGVVNHTGTNVSAARAATLALLPYEGGAVRASAPVEIPLLAPGQHAPIEGTLELPDDALGWWRVELQAPSVEGVPALVRATPEWRLSNATREGSAIAFDLANAGLRGGTTSVRAFSPSLEGAPREIGRADLSVAAGEAARGRIEATVQGPVVLVAHLPEAQEEIDQGDFGGTVALLDGDAYFDLRGKGEIVAGPFTVAVPIGALSGSSVRAFAVDGQSVPFRVEEGLLEARATLAPGEHVVTATLDDLVGGTREVRFALRAESAVAPVGEIPDEGPARDPPRSGIPAPSLALVVACAAAIAIILRRKLR